MKIKILGTGCRRCKKLYAEAEKAIATSGVAAELESIDAITKYGVMLTPSLVIDEAVKVSGRIAPASEIVAWITAAALNEKP